MRKIFVIFMIVFLKLTAANGQFFQTGQDPSSIRWRQINTINFQIIYPEEFEKQAQRVSFLLNKVYDYGSKSLNFKPGKVSVILHTRSVNSNGLLAWAPKRIELYTTPNQQIYAQDWLEQLALHEFRHLVQMDKIQSEIPALVKIILGEQAAALVVGAYLPLWFLEGDAVVTETALSNSGRGREAAFSMDYRAQLLEKGIFSFDKAYLGSYKDYVPDYYKLGYWMVGKTREKNGSQIWSDVLQKIGNQPLSLTPLNSTLKKNIGLNTRNLYTGIFNNLASEWKQDLLRRKIDTLKIVSPNKSNHTEYLFPEYYKDSLIFAYRSSIDDIGRFVLIYPDQSEKIIYTTGSIFEESVSMKENYVIWAERRADLRWDHSDRSVINILDIETGKLSELKNNNKLFSPSISPDLKSFAAVEVDPKNDIYLSVFDLKTGNLKQRYHAPDNQYFFTPCWDDKGLNIFFISLTSQGKYLASYNLKSKQSEQLSEPTFANIKNPVYFNENLFLAADFSGTDQLFAFDIPNKKLRQIVSVKYGLDYPTVNQSGNKILFSNYSYGGFQLATVKIQDRIQGNDRLDFQLKKVPMADNLALQEKGIPDFTNSDSITYSSKKYSKVGHLINIHSWAPAYIDVNNYEIRPGVSVFSQNLLGTAETRLGYDYNVANRTGRYKLGFNYLGWFPEFHSTISIGNEASNYYRITNTVNNLNQIIHSDTTVERFVWSELNADLDIRVPLNISKSKYTRMFYPELKYTFNQISHLASTPEDFYSGNYHALTYRLSFYNLLRQSTQNLMPKWGQQFEAIYRHTPFIGNDLGQLYGAQSVLYLPGFWKNAGFRIYQGYQEKSFANGSAFSDFVRLPRGFQGYQSNKMYSLATDYKFPIFYPDFSFGKLAFIKRIKTSLFYDYAWLSLPAKDENGTFYPNHFQVHQKSVGIELTSDIHVLRFFAPIELGIRSIYLPDLNEYRFDLLFSIDFNGF